MKRPAFTLIELLIVIAIMMTLFAIGVAFLPGTFQDRAVQRGGELLQRWLVMAREMAKRDKVPVGLRLLPPSGASQGVDRLQFIMRPNDITAGTISGAGTTLTVTAPLNNVNPGDYLEVNGNGLPHRIVSAGGNQVTLASPLAYPITNSQQYRIIRQAQPLTGELELEMPRNIGIDIGLCSTSGVQPDPGNFMPPADILFSPSGTLAGKLASFDRVIFYVRDMSKADPAAGQPLLVTVYKRTGFIVTHPVDPDTAPTANKYSFTLDPRSSGL